jgi:hypothetical protein
MARRFIIAFIAFVGLIFPSAFTVALLAAPAKPTQIERPGCDRNLADTMAEVAVLQQRMKRVETANGAEACTATRLYFLGMVKARAVTALCKQGQERDRDLGRLDADVAHINEAIAAHCGRSAAPQIALTFAKVPWH